MLSAARASIPERRRTTAAPMVTTNAIAKLIAATRKKSSWKTKVWNWAPNVGSLTVVPEMLANEKTSPTNPATTQTTPQAHAYRAAVIRREVLRASGMIVAATTSRPMVLAAARLWMDRTIGMPQRTTGPTSGSPATGAANAPPSSPAGMTTATAATTARIRGSLSVRAAAPCAVVISTPPELPGHARGGAGWSRLGVPFVRWGGAGFAGPDEHHQQQEHDHASGQSPPQGG